MVDNTEKKYYGLKIGYDFLNDDYFRMTEYKFDTFENADAFRDYIEENCCMVFPIGEIVSYPPGEQAFAVVPDNYVCRPVFTHAMDAVVDLENMMDYKYKDNYEYTHEVFDMDLSEMDQIHMENKVSSLEKDVRKLCKSNGILKLVCVAQTVVIAFLFVKVF